MGMDTSPSAAMFIQARRQDLHKDLSLPCTPNIKILTSPSNSASEERAATLNKTGHEGDRLQVSTPSTQRKGSFLYRTDSSEAENSTPRTSRHSSLSTDGMHSDELITPFAQILSSLKNIRANFVLLTNIKQNRFRRGSEGFHLNSRLCQLYEISDGSMIRDDMFNKLTMETLKEFDWCLDQLDSLSASMSVSEMASNKFKKMLDKELKDFSETALRGEEVSAYIYDNFLDNKIDSPPLVSLRARSKNLIQSIKGANKQAQDTQPVPRYGVITKDEAKTEKIMEELGDWKMDVTELKVHFAEGRCLAAVTYTVLQSRDLLNEFKIKPAVLVNYMNIIESHYMCDVPFHNATHAADVVQASHCLLQAPIFNGVFSGLEVLAVIIASAVHDVDHPGVNNTFLVNTSSQMALMYNDESVLENHHLAVAFQLMQDERCHILESLAEQEHKLFRKMVIEMVLATDNARHMNILGSLKTMVERKRIAERPRVEVETVSEKINVLKCMVHCADLSNPTRPLPAYKKWVDKLMQEFFRQGDIERERGMEVSPMMDRYNPNIPNSQVVFIDFVVHPLWETWAELVHPHAQHILDHLQTNRDHYHGLCQEQDSPTPTPSPDNEKTDEEAKREENVKLFEQHQRERVANIALRRSSDTQLLVVARDKLRLSFDDSCKINETG